MVPILEVRNISKRYTLNHNTGSSYQSLRENIAKGFKNIITSNSSTNTTEDFWALKDISFDINPGESVGIIGRNGAGKSTLLKILSRITPPTSGTIKIRGRIASLLEVGTGFHPELTGRENIYLNGSILGMSRVEINKNFDAIIDFSGVARFLDTPLKNYSSGMQLRLAFSVAAFLEPEVLIIDEVLAVGDAEFQKKCIGKMDDVSKSGRTVIFVSHNMGIMQQLCQKIALLHNGSLFDFDKSEKVISSYLKLGSEKRNGNRQGLELKKQYIKIAELQDERRDSQTVFGHRQPILVVIKCVVKEFVMGSKLGIVLSDTYNRRVFTVEKDIPANFTEVCFEMKISSHFLLPGQYIVQPALYVPNQEFMDRLDDNIEFEIVDEGSELSMYAGTDLGCVFANCEWKIITE